VEDGHGAGNGIIDTLGKTIGGTFQHRVSPWLTLKPERERCATNGRTSFTEDRSGQRCEAEERFDRRQDVHHPYP
jgi:hypothetical protein